MSITKQQLKQLIKEEIFKLEEAGRKLTHQQARQAWRERNPRQPAAEQPTLDVGYIPGEPGSEEHEVGLKDWASGFTGDPNDPLPSTVAKRSADLEAAKTLVSAMDPEELEQLQQHISDSLAEPEEVEALDLSDRGIGDVLASPGINKDLDRLKRIANRTVGGGR